MTVIVGISDGKRGVIAADSQWTLHGSAGTYPSDKKIVQAKNFLAGFSGTISATRPLLKWASAVTHDISEMRDRCRGDMRQVMDSEGATPKHGDCWPEYEVSGLFVYPGGVLHMDGCGAAAGPMPYWAIGNGAEYALGAIHGMTSAAARGRDITEVAISAVQAAIKFDLYCSGDVHVMVVANEAGA